MLRRNVLAAAAALSAVPAAARDTIAGDIRIARPWTRAAAANANGAAFMTLRNTGAQADRLLSASSPIARVVELHTHVREGDVMRMRPVQDIPVPAGETVELRPGGLHVMLIGLNGPLQQGARVPVTLRFERAGEVQVDLTVEAAGARGPMPGHRH